MPVAAYTAILRKGEARAFRHGGEIGASKSVSNRLEFSCIPTRENSLPETLCSRVAVWATREETSLAVQSDARCLLAFLYRQSGEGPQLSPSAASQQNLETVQRSHGSLEHFAYGAVSAHYSPR